MSEYATRSALQTVSMRPVSTIGISAVLTAKLADLATTVTGLVVVSGLTERNPFAAGIYRGYGVAGLAIVTVLGVAVVVLVVESATSMVAADSDTPLHPTTIYLVSYLPLTFVFATAAVHNAVLIATHA